ncbi:DUF58 domain-containing protein [Futiania mangrovi]|uniref:DUF58 domain-containing protein n=1 Tax=Futiania mangrovi TaxID=2959716 RepID=A0A9J6PBI8_9PROT|nr:DUF58 domain-containing protein [Futiania mangrovii]MCP1337508.1 DUF58 domain-containing protein [Futiania mangrovii]
MALPSPDAPAGRPLGPEDARPLRAEAEALGARLPPLLVEAERVAATVAQGVHGRRRVGMGETFWQYRHARAGDPATAIDWRQSAKSDRLYVRENEWEAAETVWLWCDRSASMAWRSSEKLPEKGHRAGLLTLALTSLLLRGGERVGLISHAGGEARPLTGRAALDRVLETLMGPSRGQSVPPALPLPRFSRAVFTGDFLTDPDAVAGVVRAHAARGVAGHLLMIADPVEEAPDFRGRTRFRDVEGALDLILERPESLAEKYEARRAAHRDALATLARNAGWTFAVHRTDTAPEVPLLSLYAALSGARLSARA